MPTRSISKVGRAVALASHYPTNNSRSSLALANYYPTNNNRSTLALANYSFTNSNKSILALLKDYPNKLTLIIEEKRKLN